MNKFLLIGPSGIGKSTVADILKQVSEIETYKIDREIERLKGLEENGIVEYASLVGWQQFFEASVEAIDQIAVTAKNILIDVGSGSIQWAKGHAWFLSRITISLYGDPRAIYQRSENARRFAVTCEDYASKNDFKEPQMSLYYGCRYKIDTSGLSKEQLAERVRSVIDNH